MGTLTDRKKRIKCLVCNTTHFVPAHQPDFICKCMNEDGTRFTSDRQVVDLDDPNFNLKGLDNRDIPRSDADKKDVVFKKNQPVNTYNEIPR